MIEGKDIVIIGIQPWDIEIGSNCKNIAIELAKRNRVLYVNSPIDRMALLKKSRSASEQKRVDVLKGRRKTITKVDNNLWEFNPKTVMEPSNRISVNILFDFLNHINTQRLAKQIKNAIDELGFSYDLLFNDSSMFLGVHIDKWLNFDNYVYYIRDNLVNSPFPYWNTQGKRMEPKMIKKAKCVVTNSLYYTEYAQQHNANSFMIGQGCDTSLFDFKTCDIAVAEELKDIKKPIIGYVGNLAKIRLDIDLLIYIAQHTPNWQLVLVGPQDDAFKNSILHSFENVHFLGSKPEKRLSEFIKGFDICINPQVLNKTTIGNYPRKIDEYLAMGKPVVATKTKAMVYFAEYTYLGESKEDYIQLIERALKDDSEELANQRNAFALTHSWENNVNEIGKAIEQSK